MCVSISIKTIVLLYSPGWPQTHMTDCPLVSRALALRTGAMIPSHFILMFVILLVLKGHVCHRPCTNNCTIVSSVLPLCRPQGTRLGRKFWVTAPVPIFNFTYLFILVLWEFCTLYFDLIYCPSPVPPRPPPFPYLLNFMVVFFFLTHQVQFVLSMQSWVCDLLLKHDPHTRGYTLKLTCPLRGHLQEFSGSC